MESKTYIVNNEPFEIKETDEKQSLMNKIMVKTNELFAAFWELEKVLARLTALLIITYGVLTWTSWILNIPQDSKLKLACSVALVGILSVKLSVDRVAKRLKRHGKR